MTRAQPSQQAEPGMRRCKEWSIDVQADAYKCGEGAALVLAALRIALAALRMSNARITVFCSICNTRSGKVALTEPQRYTLLRLSRVAVHRPGTDAMSRR